MGIFSLLTAAQGLTQPAAAPTELASPWQDNDYLASITLSELFGLHNLPIDRHQAMSVSAIARGNNVICTQIARFPMRITKAGTPVTGPTFADQPERNRSRTTTMRWTADSLFFFGRAYFEITERYATGYPARFSWVPEWEARTDGGGMLLAVGDRKVTAGNWIRIDGPNEGLLNFAKTDIRDAIALKVAVGHASANPVPSVELHQTGGDPMSNKEIDDLVNRWIAARRSHGVGFTNQSVELSTHGQAPEQLMISARNQSAIDLANDMNAPAWVVDASVEGSSLTYTNVPSRSREILDYTLQPYLDAIAGRLSMPDVLPAGQNLSFDVQQFLAGDFGERMTAYQTAITAGIYTADECRMIEAGMTVPLRLTEDTE